MTDRDAAPSVGDRSDAERSRFDLRLLTALVVVLIGVPSILVFAPLGGAGTPAQMFGVLLLVIWGGRRLVTTGPKVTTALDIATLIYFASVLAAYLAAATRPIPPVEISAADRGLISTFAWTGMLLFAAAAPSRPGDLTAILRRLSYAGGALAALGILQFLTKQPFTNYIQIPGLSSSHELDSITSRNALTRPAGTAIHPIEFGAVLTMILPIALHFALSDKTRSAALRWFPVVAIAVAVPISISRSAIISAAIALVIVVPTWPGRTRRRTYVALGALAAGMYLLVPGLLGTLNSLFTGISEDSSARSRTDSYGLAADFIGRAPIFGRGFRTFLPSYRILDNQYLLSLIETGIVGLAAFLGLLITSMVTTIRARRRTADPATRSLAHALTAAIASAGCSFAFYDAFSFPMAASLLFLVVGCAGAMGRVITVNGSRSRPARSDRVQGHPRPE